MFYHPRHAYGKYTEQELAEKLQHISEEEMKTFHKARLRKYRVFFFIAVACGILGGVCLFFSPPLRWFSIGFTVIGLVILGAGNFLRLRWKRLYAHMVYLKHKRAKVEDSMKDGAPHQGNKYDRKR